MDADINSRKNKVRQVEQDRLANCHVCGKLYIKSYSDCCSDCHQEIEQDFQSVNGYLRETDAELITLEGLSEATGVTEKRITDFIREGRIYGADFPKLGYPCAHCGTVIKRQMLCHSCFDLFSSDISRTLKREALIGEMNKKREERSTKVQYWQLK